MAKEIEALSLGKDPEVTNGEAEEPKPVSAKSKKKDKVSIREFIKPQIIIVSLVVEIIK